jgi:hypothetical protein
MSGIRNVGRRFPNPFKKVMGSSSSRSSSHHLSTHAPSISHRDEQAKSQVPEEQTEQQEEEVLDDSHINPQGEHEHQAYNILKGRTSVILGSSTKNY